MHVYAMTAQGNAARDDTGPGTVKSRGGIGRYLTDTALTAQRCVARRSDPISPSRIPAQTRAVVALVVATRSHQARIKSGRTDSTHRGGFTVRSCSKRDQAWEMHGTRVVKPSDRETP
jgi:hypothetical protein